MNPYKDRSLITAAYNNNQAMVNSDTQSFINGALWGRHNPTWISVSDELPNEGQCVLVKGEKVCQAVYTDMKFVCDGEQNVKYWIPLP